MLSVELMLEDDMAVVFLPDVVKILLLLLLELEEAELVLEVDVVPSWGMVAPDVTAARNKGASVMSLRIPIVNNVSRGAQGNCAKLRTDDARESVPRRDIYCCNSASDVAVASGCGFDRRELLIAGRI